MNKEAMVQKMTDMMAKFVGFTGKKLPDDVIAKLEELREKEDSPLAKVIYDTMFRNQELAVKLDRPSCQDTGVLQFWVKCGTGFPLINELEGLLKDAVVQATFATPLRHNSVETFDEYNTGKNVGKGTPTVWWDIVPNWDGCEAEVAAFKEYAETRVRLEDELIQWGSGTNNNRCSQKTMKKKAKELMCLFVDGSDGPKRYKTEVAYIGCECGWDNFDADGKLHADFKRAKKMREREIEIVSRALGHNDLMSCLCNSSAGRENSGAAMGVGLIYHAKPGSKKSECGGVGGCWAHGYGCWHYPMPTDGKSLDSCGYYRYVRDHKAEAALRRKGLKKDRECYMGL